MNYRMMLLAAWAAGTLSSTTAVADDAPTPIQRNVNQQERIEQGLQSSQLNTREAGRLEREESQVDGMESRALKDGTMSAAESARIDKAQDHVSQDIYQQKHDGQQGNADSRSSERMQADVQRNVNQQTRIENGVQSGELTNREAGMLEGKQAQVNRLEARAAHDGHVGPGEQVRVQGSENQSGRAIHRKKHNGRTSQ